MTPSLVAVRIEIRNGKSLAFDRNGLCVAEWGRILTAVEMAAYLANPSQVFHKSKYPGR